eukprot:m.12084 g.12084  ORF g.12084 m.12084 type:complete len:410 (-) comp5947_c0_seq2:31-1260(-)
MFIHLLSILAVCVPLGVFAQTPGTALSVRITNFPAYNASYSCASCPCTQFTPTLNQATVSGTITWDSALGPATNYKVAIYILMPDKYWWAKPTFNNRYAAVSATGTWQTNIFTFCLDPLAMRIAAFVIPVAENPDTLEDGRVCPCSAGPDLELSIGCLPPAQQNYPSTVIKRGPREPYLEFANRTFYKKVCTSACGPGAHEFSRSNIALNSQGLQLSIRKTGGVWRSAEVHNMQALGYGTYLLQVTGPLVPFDLRCTLGLFLYDDCSADAEAAHYRELDFEFSRWNSATDPGSQYVVQPYTVAGNIYKYALSNQGGSSQTVTLVMDWNATRIRFATITGLRTLANLASTPLSSFAQTWVFSDTTYIPSPGFAKLHLNAWVQTGLNPASTTTLTYTIRTFEFSQSNSLLP